MRARDLAVIVLAGCASAPRDEIRPEDLRLDPPGGERPAETVAEAPARLTRAELEGSVRAGLGAFLANVVALGATEPGYVSVFPCGGAVPGTSSLNFPVETPRSTLTLSGLGGGRLCAFTSARAHLIVDLVGVWVSTAGAAPDMPPATDPEDDGDDLHPDGDAGVSRADVPIPSPSDGGPTDDRGSANDVPGVVNPQRPDVPGSPGATAPRAPPPAARRGGPCRPCSRRGCRAGARARRGGTTGCPRG